MLVTRPPPLAPVPLLSKVIHGEPWGAQEDFQRGGYQVRVAIRRQECRRHPKSGLMHSNF